MKTLQELTLPELRQLLKLREQVTALEAEAARIMGGVSKPVGNPTPRKTRNQAWTAEQRAKFERTMRKKNRRNTMLVA
jgi:hypothetical protein